MIEHLRAMIILDIRGALYVVYWILGWLSCKFFFFAYYFFTFAWFRSSRLVSIEGDRRLEESSAQHANVYLRSRRIYVWDIWRRVNYVVYVWTGRIGWSIGVRYIYLISVILNVYGGYIFNYNSITACFTLLIPYSYLSLRCMCGFGSQFTLACGLRFLVDLYGQLEECRN